MAHSVYKFRKGEAYPHCYKYPQAAVTADCVVFTYDGKNLLVLLVRRGQEPFKGSWAFPGGFINPDETVEVGAARELLEETSLKAEYMEQINVFSTPDRDPRQRVITVPFLTLVKFSEVAGGDDADEAKWFSVDDMPELAFDHAKIFEAAKDALRRSVYFKPVAFELLPEKFTMSQIQRLYEKILGRKFDRRNFARKMTYFGVLDFEGTGKDCNAPDVDLSPKKRDKSLPSRIASLFSFNRNKWEQLKTDNSDYLEF